MYYAVKKKNLVFTTSVAYRAYVNKDVTKITVFDSYEKLRKYMGHRYNPINGIYVASSEGLEHNGYSVEAINDTGICQLFGRVPKEYNSTQRLYALLKALLFIRDTSSNLPLYVTYDMYKFITTSNKLIHIISHI